METAPVMIERRARNDRRQLEDAALARELEQAIAAGEIELLLQPQFRAADDSLSGAEALVGWRRKGHTRIAGDDLFEIAAQCGMARVLSAHVREAALGCAAAWPARLRLSLNVTADDLADPELADSLAAALAASGMAADRVTLEITEQALVDEIENSASVLRDLATRGIRIALDDFGAGFCNFRYLKLLPLHYLKLDRSMVDGIADDPRDLAVLRGITAMAHALGLEVIAEGIESEEQRDLVAREGCAFYQGFLRARPMAAGEFVAFSQVNKS